MKTLFIDSSRKSLSVALISAGKPLFISNINSYSKHSNFLMNEIDNILKKCNIKIYEIDNIVVLNGPGSFTGVRVGVTIAKTIAWTLSKKLYQLSTLDALMLNSNSSNIIISVFYDKNINSYVGIYNNNEVIRDYMDINDDRLKFNNKNITIVSYDENEYILSLKDKLSNNNNVNIIIKEDYDYVKVTNFALLKGSINPHLAEPIYLKKIDAEKKNLND